MPSNQQRKKVVIVGSGFGGTYTFRNLHNHYHGKKHGPEITIISKHNYFLFTPLLHEVATGSVHESNIIQPIRQLFGACGCLQDLVLGEVTSVDLQNQRVYLGSQAIGYDYLVMAAGATTKMLGFEEDLVYTLKDLADARRLKNRILELFDRAHREGDKARRRELLKFVVIGGGPTGVELAAEICEFAKDTLAAEYTEIAQDEVSVLLIHGGSELINYFHPSLRRRALKELSSKKCIDIKLNTRVKTVGPGEVRLASGETVKTHTPILVAGVVPSPMVFEPQVMRDSAGRVEVDRYFRLKDFPEVFVIGDMAKLPERSGPVPQTAQAAEAAAKCVAANLILLLQEKQPRAFVFKERAQLVSLGRWRAAARIYGVSFSGRLAWWIWRTIYATKLIGWANRVRVVVDWTLDIFFPRDTSEL